jgi:phosphoserine phosphatase
MQQILTLVAGPPARGIDNSMLAAASAALAREGASVGGPLWLAERAALDLPFEALAPERAQAAASAALAAWPIDLVAQSCEGRRKRLLLADMDSTIITLETLDELADFAGVKDKVAALTERSIRGELDFETTLLERVAMLRGLSASALERTWQRVTLTKGASTLVRTMRKAGAFTALISGGFSYFSHRVRELVGFDHDEANRLEVADGRLTGRVLPPVMDSAGKRATLERLARQQALPLAATLAVGDGANDLAMVAAAGLGIAYRGKPPLAAAARARVDHGDLTALLFFQGYRAEEFVL